jgi:hypothetical protein
MILSLPRILYALRFCMEPVNNISPISCAIYVGLMVNE